MTFLDRLARRQLLVVTGKGGVGKSSVAATLGRLLAAVGRRVLLLEIDPRESLYQLLGVEPSGGSIVDAEPCLLVQNLTPRDVLDEVVREQLRIGPLVKRVLASAVYRNFAEGAPGLKELAILGHVLRLVEGKAGAGAPEIDTVVLDAPATGHGVSLLAAPQLVTGVITEGPFAEMAAQLAAFIADAQRVGILIVTAAEEMPVQEAIELLAALDDRVGRRPELLLVNGLYPPAGDRRFDDPILDLGRQRRRVNERWLARLAERWDGPGVRLPLLPIDRGPALVRALESRLAAGLEEIPCD